MRLDPDGAGWLPGARAVGLAIEDEEGFVAHALACADRGARLDHAGDLYLAWSAARGAPDALRRLEPWLTAEADDAARRVDPSPGFADEVRQALRVRLLVTDDAGARLAGYGARGPLRGWIGVAALRVALNLRRAQGPARHDVLVERLVGGDDVELRYLKTLYRAEFETALTAALAALDDRERALLRFTFVDGLTLTQLGRLYQVHETTAGRWLRQATSHVAVDARRRLTAKLSLSRSSLDSLARLVMSNLDLSIAHALAPR